MLAFARNQIRQAVLVQIEKDRRRKTVQGHLQEIGIQKNRPTQGFPHAGILYPEKPETSVFHAQHHLVLPVPIQITKARIQSPQSPFGKPKKIIRNQFKSRLARRADIPQQSQRRNHHRVPITQFVISPRFPAIIAHHQIGQPVVVVIVSHRISPRSEIQHPVLQEILLQQAAPSRPGTRLGITPDALRAFGIERVGLVRRQQVAQRILVIYRGNDRKIVQPNRLAQREHRIISRNMRFFRRTPVLQIIQPRIAHIAQNYIVQTALRILYAEYRRAGMLGLVLDITGHRSGFFPGFFDTDSDLIDPTFLSILARTRNATKNRYSISRTRIQPPKHFHPGHIPTFIAAAATVQENLVRLLAFHKTAPAPIGHLQAEGIRPSQILHREIPVKQQEVARGRHPEVQDVPIPVPVYVGNDREILVGAINRGRTPEHQGRKPIRDQSKSQMIPVFTGIGLVAVKPDSRNAVEGEDIFQSILIVIERLHPVRQSRQLVFQARHRLPGRREASYSRTDTVKEDIIVRAVPIQVDSRRMDGIQASEPSVLQNTPVLPTNHRFRIRFPECKRQVHKTILGKNRILSPSRKRGKKPNQG